MSVLISSHDIDAAFERLSQDPAPAEGTLDAYRKSVMFNATLLTLGRSLMEKIKASVVTTGGDELIDDVFIGFEALGVMFFEAGYHAGSMEMAPAKKVS